MKLNRLILIVSVFLFSATVDSLWAKGLSLAPASYEWKNIEIGKRVKSPPGIVARNDSKELRSYVLRIVKPSEIGLPISPGYKEIPSTEWISFEQKILPLEPGKWSPLALFIEIPKEKKYLGQKWEFYLEVKEYTTGLELFTLACQMKFLVTTAKKPAKK